MVCGHNDAALISSLELLGCAEIRRTKIHHRPQQQADSREFEAPEPHTRIDHSQFFDKFQGAPKLICSCGPYPKHNTHFSDSAFQALRPRCSDSGRRESIADMDLNVKEGYIKRTRMHWALRKLVAVMVLVWALADLTVPGVCQTDFPVLNGPQPATLSAHGNASRSAHLNFSHQPQSQNEREDDCFCCCSHIVHSCVATFSDRATVVEHLPAFVTEQPHEFSTSLYHPPRY